MLNYADRIDRRLDRMPISRAHREIAKVEFAAAEVHAERMARALVRAAGVVASIRAVIAIHAHRLAH